MIQLVWNVAWPLPALAAATLFGANARSAWPIVFFTLTLLWPSTLAARRIGGAGWGVVVSCICCGLLLVQTVAPPAIPVRQPATLERRFEAPDEAMRHVIAPRIGAAEWSQLWSATARVEAYVYVMVVLAAGAEAPGLVVLLNGHAIGPLTGRTRLRPDTNVQAQREEWHRLLLIRQQVETSRPLEFVVAPDPSVPFVPNAVGLLGGFSYRPTASGTASAVFTGGRWLIDPTAVLRRFQGGTVLGRDRADRVRYFIELRLVDADTRRLVGTYY